MVDNDKDGAAIKGELCKRFLDVYHWHSYPDQKIYEMTGLTRRQLLDIKEYQPGQISVWRLISATAALGCSVTLITNSEVTIVVVDGERLTVRR